MSTPSNSIDVAYSFVIVDAESGMEHSFIASDGVTPAVAWSQALDLACREIFLGAPGVSIEMVEVLPI